jgi:hypothetical protein
MPVAGPVMKFCFDLQAYSDPIDVDEMGPLLLELKDEIEQLL